MEILTHNLDGAMGWMSAKQDEAVSGQDIGPVGSRMCAVTAAGREGSKKETFAFLCLGETFEIKLIKSILFNTLHLINHHLRNV